MKSNSKRSSREAISISETDKREIRWILRRVENREAFLYSLSKALMILLEKKDIEQFKETLATWKASAEIDAIPGAKKRIWRVYEEYKKETPMLIPTRKSLASIWRTLGKERRK